MNERFEVGIHRGLVGLAFRRALTPTFIVCFASLSALWLFGNDELAGATKNANNSVLRGLQRESTWSILALFALPTCLYAAAKMGERWRIRDRDWIGSRAVSATGYVTSTYLGTLMTGTLLAISIGILAEFSVDGDAPALRHVRSLSSPTINLLQSGESSRFESKAEHEALIEGRNVRLELRATPGSGPTAKVQFTCRRLNSDSTPPSTTAVEAIVSGRTNVGLPLPSGTGAVEFTLSKIEPGCGVVALPDALVLFESVGSERAGTAVILVHVLVWLSAWIAIALALGTWIPAATATILCLALQLPLWSFASASNSTQSIIPASFFPGADLINALTLLGDGVVPSHAPAQGLLGCFLFATAGIALAVAGQKRGGSR